MEIQFYIHVYYLIVLGFLLLETLHKRQCSSKILKVGDCGPDLELDYNELFWSMYLVPLKNCLHTVWSLASSCLLWSHDSGISACHDYRVEMPTNFPQPHWPQYFQRSKCITFMGSDVYKCTASAFGKWRSNTPPFPVMSYYYMFVFANCGSQLFLLPKNHWHQSWQIISKWRGGIRPVPFGANV